MREFKIQTNLYSADIGRNSGAVVDVITKSGTNQLHGSLFEYLRNSAMDARNFFNPVGTAFPTFRLNQFGGSFGGPVVLPKLYHGKDRTFFFVDYEGYRRDSQQLQLGQYPDFAYAQRRLRRSRHDLRSDDHSCGRFRFRTRRRLPTIRFR